MKANSPLLFGSGSTPHTMVDEHGIIPATNSNAKVRVNPKTKVLIVREHTLEAHRNKKKDLLKGLENEALARPEGPARKIKLSEKMHGAQFIFKFQL